MSLRIEPVLTQACYIIGCSEKWKKSLRNQMDLKCSIIHKHFFFFFFAFVLVPIPKYSATANLLKKVWKGTKIFACFSGNRPFSHRTQGARRNGGGSFFEDPLQSVPVTCEGTGGGGGVLGRREEGLLWSWLGVTRGFLSWEVCKLMPSKLQATFPPFWAFKWQSVADVLLTGSGSPGEKMAQLYFRPSMFPHLPLLSSS